MKKGKGKRKADGGANFLGLFAFFLLPFAFFRNIFETQNGAFPYSTGGKAPGCQALALPFLVNQGPTEKEVHGETTNPHR